MPRSAQPTPGEPPLLPVGPCSHLTGHSFLFVLLGVYKQMHMQQVDVLSNINEDNFDHMFDLIHLSMSPCACTHAC